MDKRIQDLAPFGKFVTRVLIFATAILFSAESGIYC